MIINQDGNISIITQEKASILELVKKIQVLYPKFKNNHIIIELAVFKKLNVQDVVEFLQLSNTHRVAKQSFIIVSKNIDLSNVPDELIVVPTTKEAYDIIEMEDMERDLGF